MSAQTETVERSNAATPLSEDIVGLLRGQIQQRGPGPGGQTRVGLAGVESPQQRQGGMDAAAFGTGVGPLQREAGTAMQQFLTGQRQLAQDIGSEFGAGSTEGFAPVEVPPEQRNAMLETQQQQRERALSDLGEQFGMAGASLGTPQSVGQARMLSQLIPRQTQQFFDERMRRAGLQLDRRQQQTRERGLQLQGVGQQLQARDQLSNAIMGLQQMGQQNVQPFMQMASQGLFAPEVVTKEHPLVTAAGAVSGLMGGAGQAAKGIGAMQGGGAAVA